MAVNVKYDNYNNRKVHSKLGNEVISLLKYAEKLIRNNDSHYSILSTLSMTINKLNRILTPYIQEENAKPEKMDLN
tara:strand:+ start:345 stop:572 length:228 start_codon:yes stop_codon:yes gene_type:complete